MEGITNMEMTHWKETSNAKNKELYHYINPFIRERADPYIVNGVDGYYYFTASYPATNVNDGYDRIFLRRSKTVIGLAKAEEVVIWRAHPSGIMAKHIWAPELHYINGKWYMYFAAGNSDNVWNIRPYVLECSGDPLIAANWVEKGAFQASQGDTSSFLHFSLDMTYFECKGKHYVVWAEIVQDSALYIAQINPEEPWKLITKATLISKPEYDWEKVVHNVNEGPSILFGNDKIYLFFSASGTGSEYCIGRLTANISDNLLDSSVWVKSEEPALKTADLTNQSGPGHNSFVIDENENLLLVYHARPSSHDNGECGTYSRESLYDPCRHTCIKYVHMEADGTILLNITE